MDKKSKIAFISEPLCIGCGICVKKCPFEAVNIINLPKDLDRNTTHRYGPNSFKLHRLPMPRPGQVLGLVGTNGIGKSTALKILAGKMKPNLGKYDDMPDWQDVLLHFRGSELQNYFTKILEDNIKATIKPQYVDHIPRAVRGQVGKVLKMKDERTEAEGFDALQWAVDKAELNHVMDRDIGVLSGGELQRFAIAAVAVQSSDVYMFDEPSSYLDVKQRLTAAYMIRTLVHGDIGGERRQRGAKAASVASCLIAICKKYQPTLLVVSLIAHSSQPAVTSLSWSTTLPFWTTSLTTSAASTEPLEPTVLSPCPSPCARVSTCSSPASSPQKT